MAEQAQQNEGLYVGIGWESQWGIAMSIDPEMIQKCKRDSYGKVRIYAGRRKNGPDSKTKATHWIKESQIRQKVRSDGGDKDVVDQINDTFGGSQF